MQAHANPMGPEQRNNLLDIEGMRPGYSFFEQLFTLKLNDSLQALTEIPLLHVHGEKDRIVDLSHAHKFREARHHAAAKTKFRLLPLSDHDFSDDKERQSALEETADWFAATLTN